MSRDARRCWSPSGGSSSRRSRRTTGIAARRPASRPMANKLESQKPAGKQFGNAEAFVALTCRAPSPRPKRVPKLERGWVLCPAIGWSRFRLGMPLRHGGHVCRAMMLDSLTWARRSAPRGALEGDLHWRSASSNPLQKSNASSFLKASRRARQSGKR